MPIGDSTQLLGEEATRDLLVAMLQQAEEDKKLLLEACMTFERWLRREEGGLTLPEGCERDSVEGKRIFRAWWDENLNLCREAQTQVCAAIEKAEGS